MLAIFAGDGDFPKEIIKSLNYQNKKFIIINLSQKNIKNSFRVQLGQFGKILKLLKGNKVKEVIFAGKVKRPSINNLKFDIKALTYLPALRAAFKKGDGNILNFCKKILKENKINVVQSHKYSKDLLLGKNLTKQKPTKEDLKDAFKGKKILKSLSYYDNAQGIVVDNGYIISIEAAEGTDLMLKRVALLNQKKVKKSGSLIKLPKNNQNLNYDLPTIGFKTIKSCLKAKLKGIFLKKNQNIFLNKNKSIQLADKNNFFIAVI